MSSSTSTHHGHHPGAGLKTLLHTLGSKEVECHVHLTIHSVSDLPVKTGAFRVRWKFRNIDAKLAKQQQKAAALKAKELQDAAATAGPGTKDPAAAASGDKEKADSTSSGHSAPARKDSAHDQTAAGSSTHDKPVAYSSDERGHTDYIKMRKRDHTVTFEHTLDVIARMRVYKSELTSEPLKLVVEQFPNEADQESYRGTPLRIGHRYVNLAEFVGEGKLRRKYLLDSSKTNAMISVSLDITVVKAQADFTKPVLRQDHILIGRKEQPNPTRNGTALVSGGTNVVLSRPSLDRSTTSTASSSATSTTSSSSDRIYDPNASSVSNRSVGAFSGAGGRTLPVISDTEAVIEALFNPPVFASSSGNHSGAFLAPSQRQKSTSSYASSSSPEYSILVAPATPLELPRAATPRSEYDAGEFGVRTHQRRDSATSSGHGHSLSHGSDASRRPSVATTASADMSDSGGHENSARGRLFGRFRKFSGNSKRGTTPVGDPLSTSSTSIASGGRKRTSLDIVHPAPTVIASSPPTMLAQLDEVRTPTLENHAGGTGAVTPTQTYRDPPPMWSGTGQGLLAVPAR